MKYSNDEIILRKKRFNQTLYKIYIMFSWDLLFYYAISFLFLNQVKGLSTSEIIFADAFYPLFKILFQLPCTILIEKIGKRKSLIIANLSLSMYLLIVLGLTNKYGYIVANLFCSLGYIIKGISESNVLYDSLENNDTKMITFSKIEGFSSSLYFYIDAIASVAAGFLFVINPYIPMVISLIITVFSSYLAFNFKELKPDITPTTDESDDNDGKKNTTIKAEFKFYISDLKEAFKFIAKSNRLRALIMFNAIFATLHTQMSTLRRSLLTELGVPNEYFGILFAIWGMLAGASANSASKIQKRHGNQTLGYLSISYILTIIFAGSAAVMIGLPSVITFFIVLTVLSYQYTLKGPYYTLIKRYLGSFSTSTMRTKIMSANILTENLVCTCITFAVSFLTSHCTTAMSVLLIGIIFGIAILYILSYMKTRVGLKPEEYPDSDIKFNELK